MALTTSPGQLGAAGALAPILGVYDTAELIATVQNLFQAQTFLLDLFFPNIVESEFPEVAIDVDVGKRRMAPFCSPLVEGRMVESRRWQTNLFRPAYIKDLRKPDLLKPVRRQIGERLLGAMSPLERLEANLTLEMADQVDMIKRRLEWMAVQALTTGTVTIVGDGYPSPILVNFLRDPSLTLALTGAAQWGQPGVAPSDSVTTFALQVLQKSGAVVTDIIFTNSAFQAFKKDINVFNSIYVERGGNSNVELGGMVETGAVYMGKWGQFNLWLYNDWYVDPVTDIEMPMLADGTIIMASRQLQGTRAFGSILDPEFAYGPLAYAPKMWIEKNPAHINLLMQSSPIVIPSRVNAAMCATVMAPGTASPNPNF